MTNYIIAQLSNSIILLLLGLIVIIKNTRNPVNVVFALHSVAGSIWSFSFYRMCIAQNPEQGLLWAKMLHVGAMFIPVILMHLFLLVSNKAKEKKNIVIAAYTISAVMVALLPTGLMVNHTVDVAGIKYFVGPAGWYYHLFPIFFVSTVIYGFVELIKAYRKEKGLKKQQQKFLIIGSIVGYVGGPAGFYPLYNIPIPAFSFYFVAIFVAIIGFGIARYRLFDYEPIVKRSIFYFLSLLTIATILGLGIKIYLVVTKTTIPISLLFTMSIIALVSFVVLINIQTTFEKITDKLFNGSSSNRYEKLKELSLNIRNKIREEYLFSSLGDDLSKILNATHVTIFQFNEIDKKFTLKKISKSDYLLFSTLPPDSVIINLLITYHQIIEVDKVKYNPIEYGLNDTESKLFSKQAVMFQAAAFMPIRVQKELKGIVVIGPPNERIGYTEKEIQLLNNIAMQCSMVMEYMELYGKMMHENRLELIGTMASSFAHEVNNPLTSVSAYLGMLPDKIDNQKFRDQFFSIVPKEVERVTKLTRDMLNFAKSQDSNPTNVNLFVIVERAQELFQLELKKRELELKIDIEQEMKIFADEQQIYQVILNMLLNAIHASEKGKIITISAISSNSHVEIEIKDEGEGIEQENLKKIFEPFYSTKIYGTGLGLATCKRIVESHNGAIMVESMKSGGSKFTIIIPKNGDQNNIDRSHMKLIG